MSIKKCLLFGLSLLVIADGTRAQETSLPPVDLAVSVNGSMETTVTRGWPLLVTAAVLHADAFKADVDPFVISANGGSWADALRLKVGDGAGDELTWSFELAHQVPGALTLDGETGGYLAWWLSPEATATLPLGSFTIEGVLDSSFLAPAGYRTIRTPAARLMVEEEPGSLTEAEEAHRYLLFSDYEVLRGRDAEALTYLDALLAKQPTNGVALLRRGDALEAMAEPWQALHAYSQALVASADAGEMEARREPPVFVARAYRRVLQALERATTFTVSVIEKPPFHPLAGDGHTDAFAIDGIPGRELYLVHGTAYTFKMEDVPDTAPFALLTSPAGDVYSDGVDGAPASGTGVLTFTPNEHTPELLYYGSTAYGGMGWRIRVRGSSVLVAIDPPDHEELPLGFEISPVYPNPFNPIARFTIRVARSQQVRVDVYDVLGRRVRLLHDDTMSAGSPHLVDFAAGDLPSGLYTIKIQGEDFVGTRTVILYK